MFENPRRGRKARNFTTNVPKILDLKSSQCRNLVPRAFPSKNGCGREKALASAGHVSILHPEILGVINLPGFARFA